MSKLQRVETFFVGIVMILCALLLIAAPEAGYPLIYILLSLSLLLYGIRSLIYYFNMARFMVGGKAMLYKGAIIFDLGMFTITHSQVPNTYIIIYLAIAHLVTGAIDIFSAIDSIRSGSPSWRMNLAGGVLSVLVAAACIIYREDIVMTVYIYCSGLIYSGIFKIISAFRRTAIVYIQ